MTQQFLTRKKDKQAFPVGRKTSRDSGNPQFVGVDPAQIERGEDYKYDLRPIHDSRKSFYGKATVTEDGRGNVTLRSYDTDVAMIKDGKPIVYGTYSPTTLRHIKEFLKQHHFTADTSKQIMKDYGGTKPEKSDAEKSDDMVKSTAMVATLGDVIHHGDIKKKNEWKERMLKAGLGKKGLSFPDDWNKLSEKEKEKRLNQAIKVAKKDTDKDGVPDHKDCQPYNPKKQDFTKEQKKYISNIVSEERKKGKGYQQSVLYAIGKARKRWGHLNIMASSFTKHKGIHNRKPSLKSSVKHKKKSYGSYKPKSMSDYLK